MSTKKQEIGKRIREARKKKKLSQSELSELLNISPSHMSDIENGKTNIGLDIFMHITQILEVSADWLLQTNVPSVHMLLNAEAHTLLADCSPSEIQTLLKLMKEIKLAIRQASKADSNNGDC